MVATTAGGENKISRGGAYIIAVRLPVLCRHFRHFMYLGLVIGFTAVAAAACAGFCRNYRVMRPINIGEIRISYAAAGRR